MGLFEVVGQTSYDPASDSLAPPMPAAPKPPTLVDIVASGPGYGIVESDCAASMADGRIFDSYKAAKAFAHGYGWVVDERWNREVIL